MNAKPVQDRQGKSLNPPLLPTLVLWILCTDWVFQWHHWFAARVDYPFNGFGRFGILLAAVVIAFLPAVLVKRGSRYAGLMLSVAALPFTAAIGIPVLLLAAAPRFAFKYPRRVLGVLSAILRWFSSSLVGKAVSLTGVVALTAALPSTVRSGWIRVELLGLGVAMVLYMAGMLHSASNPLSFVDSAHRLLFHLASWLRSGQKSLSVGSLSLGSRGDMLTETTGFALAMTDELDAAGSSWRYFATFLGGLGVAFAVTVPAFASVYYALQKLSPVEVELLDRGFQGCFAQSFSVITTTSIPSALLDPLSWHTAAVIGEVAISFYLAAATVWAFTAGARQNTEEMMVALKSMWRGLTEANRPELEMLYTEETWKAKAAQSKANWLRMLR